MNRVEDVPEGFKEWMEENGGRIAAAKSLPNWLEENGGRIAAAKESGALPYWMRDNSTIVYEAVRNNRMSFLGTQVDGVSDMTVKELNQLAGEVRAVGKKNEMFGKGYKIEFQKFKDWKLMQWKDGKLTISTVRHKLDDGTIFCPADNLRSAIVKNKKGKYSGIQ